MNQKKKKVIIIGAGLTAMAINYFLYKKGIDYDVLILEARDRVGGRILTTKNAKTNLPIEMGATWFGDKHKNLIALLKALDIKGFEQDIGEHAHYEPLSTSPPYLVSLPPNSEPTLRIKNGTSTILDKLRVSESNCQIVLNQKVEQIADGETQLFVKTKEKVYKGDIVISTLPPYLLSRSISFTPALPKNLIEVAESTHTWMGESIKVALIYKNKFWAARHQSGTIFSNVGPVNEMYDHSQPNCNSYALKGFIHSQYYSLTKDERLSLILNQLQKYYGEAVYNYSDYIEMIWRKEPYTFSPYHSHILPHQNNGHQVYQNAYMGNKLYIAGTETSSSYPGYMEGAIASAYNTVQKLTSNSAHDE